jgi:AraC-type DNA-binding domain-containing proteins
MNIASNDCLARENTKALQQIKAENKALSRLQGQILYSEVNGAEKEVRASDFFELVFFEKGAGIHAVNNDQYEVGEKQIHISFPGHVHFWNIESCLGHRFLLSKQLVESHFSGIAFLSCIQEGCLVTRLNSETCKQFREDLHLLITELSKPALDHSIFSLRLEIIFNYILFNLRQQGKAPVIAASKYHPVVSGLKQLLEVHFKSEKDVAFYSGQLFVTPGHMNKLCQKQWGVNAKQIIDNRVLAEAVRLLMDERRYPIRKIALMLGFSNLSNFSRFLKFRTGYSPLQLRGLLNSIVK